MEPVEAVLNTFRVEDFLSSENLDRADEVVKEIFALMFGFEIKPMDTTASAPSFTESEERTAIVGFSGAMRGCCRISANSIAVKSIASAMLGGIPVDDDDDSIDDALGELCNMFAGGWKNAIPVLAAECAISPPTVISGYDYRVHIRKPVAELARAYRFGDHTLFLKLHCQTLDG